VASLTWDGLDEIYKYFLELPTNLAEAGGALADRSATECAFAIKAAYPRRSGHLIDSTIVRERKLEFGLRARVINTAAYVYAFESGRKKGNHGTTPARPTFIPLREKYQKSLKAALRALMEANGLKVTGEDE
jgi:hypothetical protein